MSANYTGGIVLFFVVLLALTMIWVLNRRDAKAAELLARRAIGVVTAEDIKARHVRRKSFDDMLLNQIIESPTPSRHASNPTSPPSVNTPSTPELVRKQMLLEETSNGTPAPSVISLNAMASSRRGQRRRDAAAASPSPAKMHMRSNSSPVARPAAKVQEPPKAGTQPSLIPPKLTRRGSLHKAANLEIVFQNLGLTLKNKSSKRILDDVSGIVESGKITAVMGPSGAGKTSLLSVLLGKAHYGKVTGKILLNGKKRKLSTLRREIGFVPQDDVMHTTLTVKEVLRFQAELRLPASWTKPQVQEMVDDVIQLLEIDDIQNSVIGDVENRGISGGQRKRVNIGMEMVANPSILALDEPTSGLDATSGLRVVEVLQNAARQRNLTVLTVLHQPRYQIFRMFDHLLLLAPGGKTVFEGATRHSVRYFEKLGYRLPKSMNPADYLLDVTSGVLPATFTTTPAKSLHIQWQEYSADRRHRMKTFRPQGRNAGDDTDDDDADNEDGDDDAATGACAWLFGMLKAPKPLSIRAADADDAVYEDDSSALLGGGGSMSINADEAPAAPAAPAAPVKQRKSRPFLTQFNTFLRREAVLHLRNVRVYLLDLFLIFMGAVLLGGSHQNMNISHILSLYTLGTIVAGIVIIIPSVRLLGTSKSVYFREASSGVNRAAYYAAVNVGHVPILIIMSVVYFTTVYTLTTPRTPYLIRYAMLLAEVFAISGMGYFVSVIFEQKSFQMAAVVLVLANGMIDGVAPSYEVIMDVATVGPAVLCASYARWMVQACLYLELSNYPLVYWRELDSLLDHYGQEYGGVDHMGQCVGALVGMGVGYRILAYFGLIFMNRAKQR